MKKRITIFFEQVGINKAGVCKEAGISQQHLNLVLRTSAPLTEKMKDKLLPIMEKYGFKK